MANPYEATTTLSTSEHPRRTVRLLNGVAWAYPVFLVATFYGTWFVAWLSLGHRPRPSLDDPKSIGVVVDALCFFCGLMLIGFPVAALEGIVLQFLISGYSWAQRFLRGVLLVALWLCMIGLLRWDPLKVVEWYFD